MTFHLPRGYTLLMITIMLLWQAEATPYYFKPKQQLAKMEQYSNAVPA